MCCQQSQLDSNLAVHTMIWVPDFWCTFSYIKSLFCSIQNFMDTKKCHGIPRGKEQYMRDFYTMPKEQVLEQFHVTVQGHTEEKAKKLLEEYGFNHLKEGKRKNTWEVFLSQFADFLVIILMIAAVISMISGNMESTIVIFAVIIMNAILGTVQHKKAEKSLDSLKSLSSPNAKVMRNGIKCEVPSKDIVPGDIVLLEAGDMVVADGRILENYSLQVNESALTGESTNVDKQDADLKSEVPLGDRINMVFSGSLVTYGRAMVVVTGTGMETEIGKIAALMNETKEKKTPLQVSLDRFSSRLAMVIMIISAIVFVLSLYRDMPILDSLMFAVALAVAAIPEALSSIVTIVQAMGTQKMAKEHAIIKELKAVESLGCVSVICSDKTGTLTQNKMTVQEVYIDGKIVQPEELNMDIKLHKNILLNAILTNDSAIADGKGIGDPTEFCLLEMARKIGINVEMIRSSMSRFAEIPFDSNRKLMSVKYVIDGQPVIMTKGALDVLLDRSAYVQTKEGIRPITVKDKEDISAANMQFSQNGLRVLAFAYKNADADTVLELKDEYDYIFTGLISMMDPPRPESCAAVADAKRAGIKPIMITGDHKITATAIARQIGIFQEGDLAVSGMELDAMSEKELNEKLPNISVYARVSPENKIQIVDAWQKRGNIVAMTGDGVNDAPALKKADIGVAMGITGTEVSKDAAAMILTDDNFATIIKAVANGRNVYRNIKNAIKFLLSGNMAGIFSVLYTSLFALPMPFAPVHLLFMNLLTDSLPAIAIGMEPPEDGLLDKEPRDPKEGILTKEFLFQLLGMGGIIAICTMSAFHIGLYEGDEKLASTMAFATLTLARLFHGFNCRSDRDIFCLGLKSNLASIGAFATGVICLTAVLFLPILGRWFAVSVLTAGQMGIILLLAFIPTAIIQSVKIKNRDKNQNPNAFCGLKRFY